MLNIDFYRPILEFLALYLGDDSEITLCDTEKILLMENPIDDTRYVGGPLEEMQKSFISNPECQSIPYTINYRTLSSSGEKMRSATMFIREEGKLIGLLTINSNVSNLINLRQCIDIMINGDQDFNVLKPTAKKKTKSKQYYEALSLSVTEMINSVIKEATERFGTPPSRLTANEKLSVIREMDSHGVFLAKGSVNEVASKLGSSKASIYRYLQQLNK